MDAISDQAKANIRRVVEALGVDHVFATTPAMNEMKALRPPARPARV